MELKKVTELAIGQRFMLPDNQNIFQYCGLFLASPFPQACDMERAHVKRLDPDGAKDAYWNKDEMVLPIDLF